MTGKTSMATLIAESLLKNSTEKVLIINFSVIDFASIDKWEFEEAFYRHFNMTWDNVTVQISQHRTVYLIMDEVQMLYQQLQPNGRPGSPSFKSTKFWLLVKSKISDRLSKVKFLLFAAYASSSINFKLSTPVDFFEDSTMFTIRYLNFTDAEIAEYVMKNFIGSQILQTSILPSCNELAIEVFCRNLKHLTGSHVGLCFRAIYALNQLFFSNVKYSNHSFGCLTAEMLIRGIWHISVFQDLLNSRAITMLDHISKEEMIVLKKIVFNEETVYDADLRKPFVRMGILVDVNSQYTLSSPVMKRYFLEKIMGKNLERAKHNPADLTDLVFRIVSSMDYNHLKSSFGKSKLTGILLERSWQMEFYKAAIQCTTNDLFISADVGALFDTSGAIDFTVHSNDLSIFWCIELLREADRIEEHFDRFQSGGRYANLCRSLTDFCLIDFRRQTLMYKIDLKLCDNLIVVCYDTLMSSVILYSKTLPEGRKIDIMKTDIFNS